MNNEDIAALVERMIANDILVLEVEVTGGSHLYLRRAPSAADLTCAADRLAYPVRDGIERGGLKPLHVHRIKAPGIGIFLHRHPVSDIGAIEVGARIGEGEIAGFIQADHRLTAVRAMEGGTVRQVLAPEGAFVGYGTELLELQA